MRGQHYSPQTDWRPAVRQEDKPMLSMPGPRAPVSLVLRWEEAKHANTHSFHHAVDPLPKPPISSESSPCLLRSASNPRSELSGFFFFQSKWNVCLHTKQHSRLPLCHPHGAWALAFSALVANHLMFQMIHAVPASCRRSAVSRNLLEPGHDASGSHGTPAPTASSPPFPSLPSPDAGAIFRRAMQPR